MAPTHFKAKDVVARFFYDLTDDQVMKALEKWENSVDNGTTSKGYNVKYKKALHEDLFRYCRELPAENDLIIANPMFDEFAKAAVDNLLFEKGTAKLRESCVAYVAAAGRYGRALKNKCEFALREQLRDVGALGDEAGQHQYAAMIDEIFGGRAVMKKNGEIGFDTTSFQDGDMRLNNAVAINQKLQKSIANAPFLQMTEHAAESTLAALRSTNAQELLRNAKCEFCGVVIDNGAYIHIANGTCSCGECSRKKHLSKKRDIYKYVRRTLNKRKR